jgi:hypothetical protein
MVYNATFKKIVQLNRGGQFYWWRNPEYVEKIKLKNKQKDINVANNPQFLYFYQILTSYYKLKIKLEDAHGN